MSLDLPSLHHKNTHLRQTHTHTLLKYCYSTHLTFFMILCYTHWTLSWVHSIKNADQCFDQIIFQRTQLYYLTVYTHADTHTGTHT